MSTLTSPSLFHKLPAQLLAWSPVVLALAVLYLPTYWALAQHTWTQDENAHGPLILAMSLYLAWGQRHALAALAARPRPLLGWPLLVFGLLLHALGRSQEVIMLEVASQIPVLLGVVLLTLGAGALRGLWFPLLFLVFMIPLPGFLVDSATGPLKQHVSGVAEQLLYLLGYPVARSGVTISIGPYQLLVADACSGLHSMFSLSAIGLLYIHLMRLRGWLRNGILIAAILPIAFAANIVRVLILALVTYHFGEATGQGLVHDLTSPIMFVVALLFLIALNALLAAALPVRHAAAQAATAPARPALAAAPPRSGLGLVLIGLAILAATPVSLALTPREKLADLGPKLDLEAMFPRQFGNWRVDESVVPLQADPGTTALLNRLYNQILSRTYVNAQGERIMLLIAYGGDQRESMQVHKPEVCYPAQGFRVVQEAEGRLDTGLGAIPVRRLVAVLGTRVEPITYWMTIGDKVDQGSNALRKLEQIKYGLTGKIPDGLLFRVSSISPDASGAYRAQADFVRAVLPSLSNQDRARIIGHPAI